MTGRVTGSVTALLLGGVVLTAAYSLVPLFASNQNQYFLHGLAGAGRGVLDRDWLAQTIDPTPVFSFFVRIIDDFLHESVFYFLTILLFGVYLFSLTGIACHIFGLGPARSRYITIVTIVAVIVIIHAVAVAWLSSRVLGVDVRDLLSDGVAGQYVLESYLQPSLFGVLLICSIYLFLRGRHLWSVIFLAAAMTFHATYALGAGVIVLGYIVSVARKENGVRRAAQIALAFAVFALPIVIYGLLNFWTFSDLLGPSQRILVQIRIPHHAVPALWLGWTVYLKVVLVLIALYLARKSDLAPVLALSLLVAVSLTVLQIVFDSNALALLFPWRISVFLVPIASVVIAGFAVKWSLEKLGGLHHRLADSVGVVSVVVIIVLSVGGGFATERHFSVAKLHTTIPIMAFVAETKSPGDVYLVPPELGDGFQGFRLSTGAPIFIDFKSIPYQAADVVEWYERLQIARRFYSGSEAIDCEALRAIGSAHGITHAVLRVRQTPDPCSELERTYRDGLYLIMKILEN